MSSNRPEFEEDVAPLPPDKPPCDGCAPELVVVERPRSYVDLAVAAYVGCLVGVLLAKAFAPRSRRPMYAELDVHLHHHV